MKPNELRIGNYICTGEYDPNHVYQVWELRNNKLLVGKTLTHGFITIEPDYSSVTPIEITEDWLLKLGLEFDPITSRITKDVVFHIASYQSLENYQYQYSIEKHTLFVCDGFRITICEGLKYIHQLQNIYFFMTGEELTLPS